MILTSNTRIFLKWEFWAQKSSLISQGHASSLWPSQDWISATRPEVSSSHFIYYVVKENEKQKKYAHPFTFFSSWKSLCCIFTILEGIFKLNFTVIMGKIMWFKRKAIIIIIIYVLYPQRVTFSTFFLRIFTKFYSIKGIRSRVIISKTGKVQTRMVKWLCVNGTAHYL